MFDVVYHGRISFSDAYNMPVFWRRWWIQKVQETNTNQKLEVPEAEAEAAQ